MGTEGLFAHLYFWGADNIFGMQRSSKLLDSVALGLGSGIFLIDPMFRRCMRFLLRQLLSFALVQEQMRPTENAKRLCGAIFRSAHALPLSMYALHLKAFVRFRRRCRRAFFQSSLFCGVATSLGLAA